MPQGVEVIFVAAEGKPSLAADEVDEQQSVEQGLRVGGGGGVVGGLVVFEKPLGNGLDIEPVWQGDLGRLAAGDGLADLLQGVRGGAVGLVPAVGEPVEGVQPADVAGDKDAVDETGRRCGRAG